MKKINKFKKVFKTLGHTIELSESEEESDYQDEKRMKPSTSRPEFKDKADHHDHENDVKNSRNKKNNYIHILF